MANHASAAKRARQSLKRHSRQRSLRRAAGTVDKQLQKLIKAGDLKRAATLLPEFVSKAYRAVKKGALHKSRAARRVGLLSKRLHNATASTAKTAAKA